MNRIRNDIRTAVLLAAAVSACADSTDNDQGPAMSAAKAPPTPVVQTVDPAFGYEGDVGKVVDINGSGFDAGSAASWERNGAPDPKITVVTTQFVSSTKVKATINIANDAALALYDVAVTTSKGRKGIGTERFEVTTAIAIEGTTGARSANDNGQVTGQGSSGAFFWSPSTGLQSLASTGIGMDLSDDGLTVVGSLGTDDAASKVAVVWTRSGGGWTQTILPRDPATLHSNARTVASDPVTGAAIVIGGNDIYTGKKGPVSRKPTLWLPAGGTWQHVTLPLPVVPQQDFLVMDVNADRVAVGNAGAYAVVWEPNGAGGWTPLLIGPHLSDLTAIDRAGTLAVGRNANIASYWQRIGSAWTGPFTLPGTCKYAVDVDDLGRILLTGCPLGGGNRTTAAVIAPPYGPTDITYLNGFGTATGPAVERMSRLGTWIAGSSALKNSTVGAYWNFF